MRQAITWPLDLLVAQGCSPSIPCRNPGLPDRARFRAMLYSASSLLAACEPSSARRNPRNRDAVPRLEGSGGFCFRRSSSLSSRVSAKFLTFTLDRKRKYPCTYNFFPTDAPVSSGLLRVHGRVERHHLRQPGCRLRHGQVPGARCRALSWCVPDIVALCTEYVTSFLERLNDVF